MDWGKGAEVYLFCTQGKRANPGTKEKSYHLVRNESGPPKHHFKCFLKSSFMQLKLHGAGAWRAMIILRIRKRSSFRMAEFLYAKNLILLLFILHASGKNPMKGVPLVCFET